MCCALSQKAVTRQEYQQLFAQIHAASNRLSVLLLQMMQQAEYRERCNITQVITELVPLFNQTSVTIQVFSTTQKSVYLYCNKLQLQELLVCLINNAIESYDRSQQKHVHIGVKLAGGTIYVAVSDFGRGWKQNFNFLPSSQKTQGGVGLPYVFQTVVKQYHGSMIIETRPQMGTRVLVKLPVVHRMRSHSP